MMYEVDYVPGEGPVNKKVKLVLKVEQRSELNKTVQDGLTGQGQGRH